MGCIRHLKDSDTVPVPAEDLQQDRFDLFLLGPLHDRAYRQKDKPGIGIRPFDGAAGKGDPVILVQLQNELERRGGAFNQPEFVQKAVEKRNDLFSAGALC